MSLLWFDHLNRSVALAPRQPHHHHECQSHVRPAYALRSLSRGARTPECVPRGHYGVLQAAGAGMPSDASRLGYARAGRIRACSLYRSRPCGQAARQETVERPRRTDSRILIVEPGGGGADVPGGGAAAHSRRGNARFADPRQALVGRLAFPCRPKPFDVRNAATWGLVLTGRLVATSSEQSLSAALTRLISRSGESIIRHGVDLAIRMMGEQF